MKALSKELLDRAVLAMVAAIEIYNKPGIPYRNESFTILAVNAWELLLKAKWLQLHGNRKRSLYIYDYRTTPSGKRSKRKYIKRTRSKAPFTHELGYLARQLVTKRILHESACLNLEIMLEFRDCATHFYNETPAFYTRLFEIGAACVKNFVNAISEWFQRDIREFNLHLMPLTFTDLPSIVEVSLLNREENNFLAFMGSIDEHDIEPDSQYSVRVNVELRFTRSKSRDALPVQVTGEPQALPIKLTEENIRERYPWDYETLTDKCRQRYDDFKQNQRYHDIRKELEDDERFGRLRFLDPGNTKSTRKRFYNPNIMTELDKHYNKKGDVVQTAPGPQNEEVGVVEVAKVVEVV